MAHVCIEVSQTFKLRVANKVDLTFNHINFYLLMWFAFFLLNLMIIFAYSWYSWLNSNRFLDFSLNFPIYVIVNLIYNSLLPFSYLSIYFCIIQSISPLIPVILWTVIVGCPFWHASVVVSFEAVRLSIVALIVALILRFILYADIRGRVLFDLFNFQWFKELTVLSLELFQLLFQSVTS